MAIYTSTIRYAGSKTKVDITAKSASGIGKYFKPTWDMVMGYKSGKYTQSQYIKMYLDILEENFYYTKELSKFCKENDVVLMCYCKAGDFCHRLLLASYMQGVFDIEWKGEV